MDRASSPAYAALPKTARRMLAVITKVAGGGSASISYVEFMGTHHFGRPSISAGLKALDALGMIDIERGPRAGNVFRLTDLLKRRRLTLQRRITKRLAREARAIMPQRRFEKRRDPVQPPPPVRVIEPVPETHGPMQFVEREPSMPLDALRAGSKCTTMQGRSMALSERVTHELTQPRSATLRASSDEGGTYVPARLV